MLIGSADGTTAKPPFDDGAKDEGGSDDDGGRGLYSRKNIEESTTVGEVVEGDKGGIVSAHC